MDEESSRFALRICDPSDPKAKYCLEQYFLEIDQRFDGGFDASKAIPASDQEMRPPEGLFVLALFEDEPVGCVGLKLHGENPAEMKRLWVSPSVRGRGLGRRLVLMVEELSVAHGVKKLQLDTNHALVEAVAMYRSYGYREVPAFNEEIHADHWFEKDL